MPDSFKLDETHPNEAVFNASQELLRNQLDPIIDSGTSEQPCPMRYTAWRTHAEIALRQHELQLGDLLHNRSLRCADPNHGQHPFCNLQKRFRVLVKSVAVPGNIVRTLPERLELGDELPADSKKPWSTEEKTVYDTIIQTIERFEREHTKIKAQIAARVNAATKAPNQNTPSFVQQSTDRARSPQPLEQQPLITSAAQRQARTEQERLAANISGSLVQEGVVTRMGEGRQLTVAPRLTAQEIEYNRRKRLTQDEAFGEALAFSIIWSGKQIFKGVKYLYNGVKHLFNR